MNKRQPGWEGDGVRSGWRYLCPSSWATVKARGRPVSSQMLQLRWGWHMPATCDMPSVSQGWFLAAHRSFLSQRTEAVKASRGQNLVLVWQEA